MLAEAVGKSRNKHCKQISLFLDSKIAEIHRRSSPNEKSGKVLIAISPWSLSRNPDADKSLLLFPNQVKNLRFGSVVRSGCFCCTKSWFWLRKKSTSKHFYGSHPTLHASLAHRLTILSTCQLLIGAPQPLSIHIHLTTSCWAWERALHESQVGKRNFFINPYQNLRKISDVSWVNTLFT